MGGERIKQLRLAQGWTLDELVARIGGIVTKQAISKYEQGLMAPSAQVLNRIAKAFNIKAVQLLTDPRYKLEFVAYRKRTGLGKKEMARIDNFIKVSMEERLKLQDKIYPNACLDLPVQEFNVNRLDDVEAAAETIRRKWNLGQDYISNVTELLENHLVHLIEIEASEHFDGRAALVYEDHKIRAGVIVYRKGTGGERQRLNLSHELGHLVLKVPGSLDEEKAVFRFGTAFLAPRDLVLREVGKKRTVIGMEEMIILKKKFGMSLQAILYRLKDLDIISESYYSYCCRYISEKGWRKNEPGPLPAEKPQWLRQNVLRALAEDLISQSEAESLLIDKVDESLPLSLQQIREFLKLPLEERRRLLSEQARKAAVLYSSPSKMD